MNPRLTRRSFLRAASAAGAAALLPRRVWARPLGANDDVRVAVIGLNGRGRQNHLANLLALKGVRVAGLCDPDPAVLARAVQAAGRPVPTHRDLRELLASSEVDAVTIATPNHWHALAAVWACQAGKDVYVEKPVSHDLWEGRQLAAVAGKYGRVVQAGTQIRSGEGLAEAVAWVRSGALGRITAARGFCYKRRDSIGRTRGPQPVPAGLDYDLWTGPAPLAPPRRNTRNGTVHYDWHWFWAYGNGDLGNQGIHQVDVARWFLGDPGLPRRALAVGARLGYEDDGETPNTQAAVFDYPEAPLVFEVRGLPEKSGSAEMDRYRGVSIGNVIECEGGSVVTGSYFAAQAHDRSGKLIRSFEGRDRHMANFIEGVRAGRGDRLFAPVAGAAISAGLCHLANISNRLGRGLAAGELRERIAGDAPLAEAFGRMREHLGANGVDLDRSPAALGVPVEFDEAAGRFVNNPAADALISNGYREPFILPKLV